MKKTCTKCKEYRPLVFFYKSKRYACGYRPICSLCHALYTKEWKIKNREKHLAQLSRYTQKNRKKLNAYHTKWRHRNLKEINAKLHARKKRIKIATPSWANKKAILDFYKKCPNGYHVDHIIPLNGDNICGLHVLSNLQYLPAKLNLSKGNRF